MKITRILLIVLALILALSLLACEGKNTAETEAGNATTAEQEDHSTEADLPDSTETEGNTPAETDADETEAGNVPDDGECAHVAGAPDPEDECNIKCTKCGEVLQKKKHTKGAADPEDNCNVKCTVCDKLLIANKHSNIKISDSCQEICGVCGIIVSDDYKHVEPAEEDWKFDIANPQNESATCTRCNAKSYRPASTTIEGLTFLSPDILALMPIHGNLIDVTVETDEGGMKYYHAIGKAGGAEATLVFNNGQQAMMGIGDYVALLIRKNLGTATVECLINYAGRTDHRGDDGQTSAATSTQPLKTNGEWQLVIFNFSGKDQLDPENGIGWARFDVMNGGISEGEIVDIAFAGFFTSTEAVYEYFGAYVNAYGLSCAHIADGVEKLSQTVEGKVAMTCTICGQECNIVDCGHNDPADWTVGKAEGYRGGTCSLCGGKIDDIVPFTMNFDAPTSAIDGVTGTVVSSNTRSIDKPLVIDASAFVLKTAKSLAVGGWCVTPAGISAYKFRIVSVDGVAVENPELIDWFTGANLAASNGVTQVGMLRGWSEACGVGSGFQSQKVLDFTGYEGKTICVELVAVTTYGSTFVFSQINNIKIPG